MNRPPLPWTIVWSIFIVVLAGRDACAEAMWTADLGTTGIGLHASVPIADEYGLHARFGTNYLRGYKFNKNTRQVSYDFKASLRTIDALIDWHPVRNGFRMTTGIVYNNNVVTGIGVPRRVTTFAFENGSYSTTQIGRLDGRIDFRQVAPYLGVGWQVPNNGRGWSISSDLGVMYQGSPRTKLSFGGCTLPGIGCGLLANALAPLLSAERQRVNDELRAYRFFPVLRVGVGYRF